MRKRAAKKRERDAIEELVNNPEEPGRAYAHYMHSLLSKNWYAEPNAYRVISKLTKDQ